VLRIGLAQLRIRAGDREANRRSVRAWLQEHCISSAVPTVVVLPEIWDVGYVLDRAPELADPEGAGAAAYLGGLAREFNVWFAVGSVLAATESGFVNRGQVINPQGELVAIYDKVHLIPLLEEDKYLQSGSKDCLFALEGATAGCVICYDIRFCEWLRSYALKGAAVLFVAAEWPAVRADHWRILLQARAVENMMFVVGVNCCGESAGTTFGGNSVIFDPWGRVVVEYGNEEGGGTAMIDPSIVDGIRDHLKVFSVRSPHLYGTVCAKTGTGTP
jgi:predicted amidohydrolase